MEIVAPCVVTLTWVLHDAQGEPIDALKEPLEFFFGGDDLLAKVEEALAGQEEGSRSRCIWSPSTRLATTMPTRSASRIARCFQPSSKKGCSSRACPRARARRACPKTPCSL
jgi:hypothetical protein